MVFTKSELPPAAPHRGGILSATSGFCRANLIFACRAVPAFRLFETAVRGERWLVVFRAGASGGCNHRASDVSCRPPQPGAPARHGEIPAKLGAEQVATRRVAGLCAQRRSRSGGGRKPELSLRRFCSRLANRDMRLGASAGKTEPVEVAPVAGGGSGACDLRSRCRSAHEDWVFLRQVRAVPAGVSQGGEDPLAAFFAYFLSHHRK